MLVSADFQRLAETLQSDTASVEQKLAVLNDVRESIEITQTGEYVNFLRIFFPAFMHVLRSLPMSTTDDNNHKTRNTLLEILNRLPLNEIMRPFSSELMSTALQVLSEDNEENGLLCLRISFELHKQYRPALEDFVPKFLDLVRKMFENIQSTYTTYFASAERPPVPDYMPCTTSFKLLAEVPIQLMFLINLYSRTVTARIPSLVPILVQGAVLAGPSPDVLELKPKQLLNDLKHAQVKILSFLTWMLRTFPNMVAPHQDPIASALVRSLQTCPDIVSLRKELLVATRHVLSTPLKAGFLGELDLLCKEETLVGSSRITLELRPLAFSMLAELVHHVRSELSLPQLSRIIYLFCRNMHDNSLPTTVQCTSIRLLLNLVEVLFSRRADQRSAEPYRVMLAAILDAFTAKLSSLHNRLPELLAHSKVQEQVRIEQQQQACAAEEKASQDSPSEDPAAPNQAPEGAAPHGQPGASGAPASQEGTGTLGQDPAAHAQPVAPASQQAQPMDTGAQPAVAAAPPNMAQQGADQLPPGLPVAPAVPPPQEAQQAQQVDSGTPGAAGVEAAAADAQTADGQAPREDGTTDAEASEWSATPLKKFEVLYTQERSEKDKEVSDARLTFSTLIAGMKTLCYSIYNYGNTARPLPGQHAVQPPTLGLRENEMRLATRMIKRGLPCLQLFGERTTDVRLSDRHADIYDSYADMFTVLAQERDVIEVFSLQMPCIFEGILQNEKVLRVIGTLFGSVPMGLSFARVLLHYILHKRLTSLAHPFSKEGELTLKLLNLFFDAVAKFQNMDTVLQPIFYELVAKTVQQLHVSRDKEGFLDLLLNLFRTVQVLRQQPNKGDMFCAIFTGSAPGTTTLLGPTIETLTSLLDGPQSGLYKSALLELCLILPARLSEMVVSEKVVLKRLMPPLVEALGCSESLVTLALHTLEYWVDSLNPEFLEPAMLPVIGELMRALWTHLRPVQDSQFGAKALKLLGKFGGRNRRFLMDPLELDLKSNPEHGLRLILTFQPATSFLVPLDRCLALASQNLFNSNSKQSIHEKQEGLRFLHICLASVLNLRSPDESELSGTPMDKLASMLFGTQPPPHIESTPTVSEMGVKTKTQLLAERAVLRQLITSVIAASADKDLNPKGKDFAVGVYRHFALLFATGACAPPPSSAQVNGREQKARVSSLKELDQHLFLDALVDVLSEKEDEKVNAAVQGVGVFVDTLLLISRTQDEMVSPGKTVPKTDGMEVDEGPCAQDQEMNEAQTNGHAEEADEGTKDAHRPPSRPTVSSVEGSWPAALDELLARVLHCCYGDSWSTRIGGLSAVTLLAQKLPVVQLRARLPMCVRALLAVMRSLPDHAIHQLNELRTTLFGLLGRCLVDGCPAQAATAQATEARTMSNGTADEKDVTMEDANKDDGDAAKSTTAEDADTSTLFRDGSGAANSAGESPDTDADAPAAEKPSVPEPADVGTDKTLEGVVQVVAHELLSQKSSEALRKLADGCLQIVSSASGRPKTNLLKPLLEKMQPPLEKRRLMPLKHAAAQIGNAAAFTYCLQQRPCLLPLSQEVVHVISDAYVLSEMDDAAAAAAMAGTHRGITDANKAVERLRSTCLSMLCAAMQWDLFRDSPDLQELRGRIIQVFFKHLTSSNEIAVDMSQEGLAAVIAYQKMPKTLLQTSLRPILVNLAYYNKLKLPLLRGLARLLKLLASWFNVTLGERLIDHLKKWLEPEKLLAVQHSWDPGQECQIAAAILDLFHLLPPPAVKFLETQEQPGLVVLVIELENALAHMHTTVEPSKMWSPYREPLAKFLNKYTVEAVEYFLETSRMANTNYFHRFVDILRSPMGNPLLAQLAASEGKLKELLAYPSMLPTPVPGAPETAQALQSQQSRRDAHYHAAHLLAIMTKLLPEWLPEELFNLLHQQWNSPARRARVADEEKLERHELYESKRIAKAMLTYLARHHHLVGPLYDLLDIFTVHSRVDFSFLQTYFRETVAKTYSLEDKRRILYEFLDAFQKQSRPVEQLVQAASLLILPMLEAGYDAGENIVDEESLTTMVNSMFDQQDGASTAYGDAMKVELLQMATLMIRRAPGQLVQNRKEFIKFGWNNLKKDDSAVKYYAFQNVCHFFDAYAAPEKIVLQVFVALLRLCQADNKKALVRDALDTLTPVLVRRLAPGDLKYPIWVRYTKKVLVEEGHSTPHLIHIWQLLVRHADLYYSSRMQFVPQIVNGLMKLGLHNQASPENRKLSLDLAGLIVYWEQRRLAESRSKDQAEPPSAEPSGSVKRTREESQGDVKMEDAVPEEGPQAKQPKLEPTADQASGVQQQAAAEADASGAAAAASGVGDAGGSLSDMPALSQRMSVNPAFTDQEWQLNSLMKETLLTFLTRIAFLLGDSNKDQEAPSLLTRSLSLLDESLALWPNVPVKMSFLNRMLEANLQQGAEPPNSLLIGLEVMKRFLKVQPLLTMQQSHQQVIVMLEPAFCSGNHRVIALLCDMLRSIYTPFPVPSTNQPAELPKEVHDVYAKVHEIMTGNLGAAGTSQGLNISPGSPGLLIVCASMRVLSVLEDCCKDYANRFTHVLVKLINRVARDHASPGGFVLDSSRQAMGRSREVVELGEPEYGTLNWVTLCALKLTANKVLTNAERKKLYLQTLVLLITGNAAKHTDLAIVMGILSVVRTWLLHPVVVHVPGKPSEFISLTEKEAILFLQRLATLARSGYKGPVQQKWEATFLDMIHMLCTSNNLAQGEALRSEVFDKVERVFLLGLRASDPAVRAKFFQLYNAAIPVTLFDRLRFIVCNQEWEHLADTFWLKQGLDLVLAVLVEREPIKLAPNSAQIPALLAKTKQNIYQMRQSMGPAASAAASVAQSTPEVSNPSVAQAPGQQTQAANAPAPTTSQQSVPMAIKAEQDSVDQAQPMQVEQGVGPGPAGQAAPALAPASTAESGALPTPSLQVKQEPAAMSQATQQQLQLQQLQQQLMPPPPAVPPGHPQAPRPGVAPAGPPGAGPQQQLQQQMQQQQQMLQLQHSLQQAQQHQQMAAMGLANQQSGPPQQPSMMQSLSGLGGPPPPQQQPFALPPPPGPSAAHGQDSGAPPPQPEPIKVPQEPMIREVTAGLTIPEEVDDLMREHIRFLYREGSYEVRDMVSSVTEVAHGDPHMACHLWVLVFPIVWATLSEKKEQQIQLAKPIIALLSKEYHLKQAQHRPNVVQALLEGISLSQPQPKIPSELIRFLGKTYSAWHIAIPLLESHVMLFPQETRCFDCLAELYDMLNEDDVLFGLWKRRGAAQETRAALSCIQHGMLVRGQDFLEEAINKNQAGAYQSADPSKQPSKGEMAQWNKQYLRCAAEMSQWETVAEYASVTENYGQLTDCLWRMHEWQRLKELVLPKTMVEETPNYKMVQTYVHLQDGHVIEADKHTGAAISKALEQWWQLPDVGVWPQMGMLMCFQRLVELQESTRILMDLGQPAHNPNHQYAELKDILETWRLRTPNEWEQLTVWSDVLTWRNAIYNVIINAFKHMGELAPHLHQLGYKDKAWSVNRLAAIARKHGCPEVAKHIIATQYGFNAMEVQEAFVKITEQAKASLEQPRLYMEGVNLLSSQNLDYFSNTHQAEIFRLHGQLLAAVEDNDAANKAFATSLALWPQLAEGWLSWGTFCDKRAKGDAQNADGQSWLENAVTCYLQAIRHGSAEGRGMMARILNLLSFHDTNGVVSMAIRKHGRQVPLNNWLPYLPQLQTSLQRPEAAVVKDLLSQLATAFPQAVYYGLRTILLSLREAAVKAVNEARQAARTASGNLPPTPAMPGDQAGAAATGSTQTAAPAASFGSGGQGGTLSGAAPSSGTIDAESNGKDSKPAAGEAASKPEAGTSPAPPVTKTFEKPPEVVAFESGKEIMDLLRNKHPHAITALELMMTEIGTRFVPKAEERLLAVVHALLHRCYKMPFSNNAEVPASLKKELSGVCKACFSNEHMAKHSRMGEYREQFVKDLDPSSPGWPATLGDLSSRLKTWRATLQSTVEDSMPPYLRLEDEARNLQEQSFTDVEMPGQYLGTAEVSPDSVVYLERFGANVGIVRRHATSYRRLALNGSNGKTAHFLVQTGQHWSTPCGSADERMMQLLRNMNRLLEGHPQSRRRHLAWHTPIIVPVYPQVRLVEEETSYCSYGEAYEVNCARYGREADQPISHFKKRCCSPNGNLISDPDGALRLQAYQEIEQRLVSETVFSQYMYKTLPSCNHLWAFKKQFCCQMALSGLLCHMLLVGGRMPYKILFARNSGKTFQVDFIPSYDQKGILERTEPVPFRLTRNLHTFFTPFGVEGVFVSAMAAAAQAIMARDGALADLLALFLRDDISAWGARRMQRGASMRAPQLKQLVDSNIDACVQRMSFVRPREPPEGQPISAQKGAQELVEQATSPRNLCRMDPTWHPWL